MNKGHRTDFKKGDEVSYSMPAGVHYGSVTRVLGTKSSRGFAPTETTFLPDAVTISWNA